MSDGFFEALTQITRERKVDRDVLIETLTYGLTSAVRRKHGSEAEVEVEIDPAKSTIEVHLVMEVVTEEALDNEDRELTVDEARAYIDDPEIGDVIRIPLDVKEFGRNAIMTAKQVLVQGVREAERERIFNEYSKRVGEVVSGTVQQVDRGNILVNLGRAEAILPYREQIRRERWQQGATVRGLVLEVQRDARGPQIVITRTHPDFLLRLFEQEIPEIYEGLVGVKSIAREPGWRSKVAVFSNDDRVDPVGACVGMKGARVMAIVKELSGERIDIVPWDDDINTFVSRALSPAQVSSIRMMDWESQALEVIVEEDQLSLAIGKEGQNVRLAAKLTNCRIDLVTSLLLQLRREADEFVRVDVSELEGITPRLAEVLKGAGLNTAQDLVTGGEKALDEIEEIGLKTCESLLSLAQDVCDSLHGKRQEFIEKRRKELEADRRDESKLFNEELFDADADADVETDDATEEVSASPFAENEVEDEVPEVESDEASSPFSDAAEGVEVEAEAGDDDSAGDQVMAEESGAEDESEKDSAEPSEGNA
ncbi:MAG: transcription termination factor NusA [bacterium]|nr:transcription termination factor NusA [bacterium]